MEEINVNDFSAMRKKKKKKRNFQKFIGFMTFLVVAIGLYVSRDRWIPKTHSSDSTISNNEISSGNFPLNIINGVNYQYCEFGEGFALLSDTRFYIYSDKGELIETRQHTYSNTILKYAGRKALVYEQGGSSFKVEGVHSTLYEKKTDGIICMAEISEKGDVAVVSLSDQFVCDLKVYDMDGSLIYSRECSQRVIDLVFNQELNGCYITSIDASEGRITSKSTSLLFNSSDDLWQTEPADTCCVEAYAAGTNGLFVFGDTRCSYYDNQGVCRMAFDYKSTLLDESFKNNVAALVLESKERRATTLEIINGYENSQPVIVKMDKSVKSIHVGENAVYVLSESDISAYSFDGSLLTSMDTVDTYKDFYLSGDYIMLLGYNKIDKMEFHLK